jgi:hypothetical protein
MIYSFSIKLKAALLLAVFSLNTAVGFACSLDFNMGFNEKHHGGESTESVAHIHKDGKKHPHHGKSNTHNQALSHKHEAKNKDQSKNDKDNCCNDKVRKFVELDKSVPNNISIIHPTFFIAFIAPYYNISLLPYTDIVKDIGQFVRSYHPPISNIRIAIQSFQI